MTKGPDRKISEALLDFSSPLIEALGRKAKLEQVDKVLRITYTVWNSVVIDKIKGDSKRVSALKKEMRDDPVTAALIGQLISRKNKLFADDLRIIGEYKVIKKWWGHWRLRADARDPSGIR